MTIEAATKRAEIIAKLAEVEDPSRFDRMLVGQLARRIVEDLSSLRSPDGGGGELASQPVPPAMPSGSSENHTAVVQSTRIGGAKPVLRKEHG